MSDAEGPVSPKASPKKEENLTQRIANLSDGESEEHRRASPSPPREEDSLSDEDRKRNRHDAEIAAAFADDDEEPPAKRVPVDAHERTVVRQPPAAHPVDLLHFPPTLAVSRVLASNAPTDRAGSIPVSFRVSNKVRGSASAALFRAARKGAHAISDVLESNANLVTWPDGTRTLVVGDETYTIVADAPAADVYVLRRGPGVQTLAATVGSVGRVQACAKGGGGARPPAAARAKGASARRPARKMLRTLEHAGEHEEKLRRDQAARRERERATAEARRRRVLPRSQTMQRSSAYGEESEGDISEEEADRIAERMPRRRKEAALTHRKAGGGRRIQDSDLEDSESD